MNKEHRENHWVRFKIYWLHIFLRSAQDIWKYIREAVSMALLGIVIVIAVSILATKGIIEEAIANGYISDASSLIRTVVALSILSFFYFLWSIFKYPPIIQDEKEAEKKRFEIDKNKEIEALHKELQLLEEKLNQEPVNVDLDIYEWERYDDEPDTLNKMVCIVVKNLGSEDIRCYGAITSLFRINADETKDNLYGEAIRNGSLVSWSGGGLDDNQEVSIKAGHERILNIAHGISNNLVFKMQNLDFYQIQNGTYVFDIEIGGHVLGKKIRTTSESFYIEYEKLYKTYAGGEERPYGSTDFLNKTSVTSGYHQYNRDSFRKLTIKKLSK